MTNQLNDYNKKKKLQPVSAQAPTREIRAIYDASTVRVYQAYNDNIADAAVAAQSFRAPLEAGIWSETRMTWIKPSKIWMAYRCGFTMLKDRNQARVLALDISRSKFDSFLQAARLSHHGGDGGNAETKRKKCRDSSVVVQWDPERILNAKAVPKQVYTASVPSVRSIQIGLRGNAVKALLDPSVVVRIADVTQDFRNALEALRLGDVEAAQTMLFPDGRKESLMQMSQALCENLDMNTVAKKDAVVVLGSAANPPHQGHFFCLKAAKEKVEEMGYNVLFTTIAAAPHGYVKTKIDRLKGSNNGSYEPLVLTDEARLELLGRIAAGGSGESKSSSLEDALSFQRPARCFGSALECGRKMRPSEDVTVVVVVGADRCKHKWRKASKNDDQATVCCSREALQLASLVESYNSDKKNGLVLDDKYYFAGSGGEGPATSSTQVRSILQKEQTARDTISQLIGQCGYTPQAAEYLYDQAIQSPLHGSI